jgi:hypothetical protein
MPTATFRLLTPCLIAVSLAGCSWIPYAVDNVHNSVTSVFHESQFRRESRRIAAEIWAIESGSPRCLVKHSRNAYEDGFKEGFCDYLEHNTSTEPPVAPPRYLRSHVLRSHEEQQEIHDWFAGFRHGAAAAAQGDWRDRIVVPLALPPNKTEERFGVEIIPRSGIVEPNAVPGAATFDPPPPRKIETITDGVAIFD